MKQGYLPSSNKTVTRIRIAGKKSYLTIKGENQGAVRSEYEYEIPISDAHQILNELCEKPIVEKERYNIEYQGKTWEIDIFQGDNRGLILAEVELESEDEAIEIPPWVSDEVTSDPKYYNSNLVKKPFKTWGEPNEDHLIPFYEVGSTLGINRYVHLECLELFLSCLEQKNDLVQPNRIKFWKPKELIGLYDEINSCDFCGKKFKKSDRGYLGLWITSVDQITKLFKHKYKISILS